MNINAASLADILRLNGTLAVDEKNGKGKNGTGNVSGTSGVSYTEGTRNNAGIIDGTYTRQVCNSAEECNGAGINAARTREEDGITAGYEQVKDSINTFVNSVSADGYEKFEKLGIIPDREEPDTFLTVAERIEIELAAHCENYVPTGSIDIDDVQALYGNTGRAYEIAAALERQGLNITYDAVSQIENGLKMAEELERITPEMSAYLLRNELPISIENVYKAQYSVTQNGNSNSIQISGEDWEQLSTQITDKLEMLGMPVDEQTLQDARWMLENNIPVTASNLWKMQDIRNINNIDDGAGMGSISETQWIYGMAAGLALGTEAAQMGVENAVYGTVIQQAAEAVEILENGNEEQIETIISEGKEVTLLNMKKVQEETVYAGNEQRHQWEQKSRQEKHYLEEIKLTMSVSGFALLIKNGFELQIASLQDIAENLREQRDIYTDAMLYMPETQEDWGEQDTDRERVSESRELFWSSISYIKEFTMTPAYVLGSVAAGETAFEVQEMCVEGAVKESILRSAKAAYETLGTRPRGDLGDSIQKAFAGVDDILKDMGIEETPANERAVRILAYNEMEITKENLLVIKELDMEVSRLIDNMTPRTTAYLINNGMNPLKTDIRKLNDKLDEINAEIEADTGEKFSQFLWNLERRNEITPENRKTYIGIYRALHMIQKSDRRAIGELVKEGGALTLQSLLTAARSIGRHMDTAVDDETGLTEQTILPDNNLDVQLEQLAGYENLETEDSVENSVEQRYMETLMNKGMDLISPMALSQFMEEAESMNLSLEQFVNQLIRYSDSDEQRAEKEAIKEYYDEIIREDAEARVVSETVIRNLLGSGVTPSISNLLAASGMLAENGKNFLKLLRINAEEENAENDEAEENLLDAMDGEEEFDEVYGKMTDKISEDIEQSAYEEKINVSELREMNQRISYVKQSAAKKSYYIPVKIGNENTTIHLTLRTGMKEKGKLDIELDTGNYGNLKGKLTVQAGEVEMEIQTDSRELEQKFELEKGRLAKDIQTIGMTLADFGNENEVSEILENEQPDNNTVSTDKLYQLAKRFIYYVKVSCND